MILLQAHEQLWAQLQQVPVVFDQFLNEFMAYAPYQQEPESDPDEDELERTANSMADSGKPLEELPIRTAKPKATAKTKATAKAKATTKAKATKEVN